MPDDRIWALKEAAKPSGMVPHAASTAKFLKTMELEGLVRQSDTVPVWFITDAGCQELEKLERADEIVSAARDLVALWEDQNIRGLPRAERNKAIDGTRERLILAVKEWEEARWPEKSGKILINPDGEHAPLPKVDSEGLRQARIEGHKRLYGTGK